MKTNESSIISVGAHSDVAFTTNIVQKSNLEKPIRILILEYSAQDTELIKVELSRVNINFISKTCNDRESFIKELLEFEPDIILSDHSLLLLSAFEALAIVQENNLEIPLILVSSLVSDTCAMECVKTGVADYLFKDNLICLPLLIKTILAKKEIQREKKIIEHLNRELQKAYCEIAEKNKDVTDSIEYARRIQEAMLPEKNVLHKAFQQSFILYKPKDIVSGDFYWFHKYEDKFIIAVVDCTGHGVPGSLMSMIGYNLLNEIVNIKKIIHPGEILKLLNETICKVLKQNRPDSTSGDGMDMAICMIDKKNNQLEYAGANRPLLFFDNGSLNIIKGNKCPVGGTQTHPPRYYTNHVIPYKEDDSIYLFTDGYIDQFGGRNDKKMLIRNFVKLLQFVRPLEISQQLLIFNEWLEKWMGNTTQTDDILLVGIKF